MVEISHTHITGDGAIIQAKGTIDPVTQNVMSLSVQVIGYYADPVEDRYCELCGDLIIGANSLCGSCCEYLESIED